MGHLTPKDFEYDLLKSYIVEALSLLGQECLISIVKESINDLGRDKYFTYNEPIEGYILFVDDLTDNKVNSNNYWRKETGNYIEAYIRLSEPVNNLKDSIVDITPRYWNGSSKFKVQNVYGQVNTTYNKVHLVPYRESLSTNFKDTLEEKVDELELNKDGLIQHRQYLKRDKK